MASPHIDDKNQLEMVFSGEPIQNFLVLTREGLGPSLTDSEIKSRLNQTIVELLKQARFEIPLLKNKKLKIPYIGIDSTPDSSPVLSVYLKAANN